MSRIALYVDCANIYHTVKHKFHKSPNYKSLLKYIKSYIGAPTILKAYGAQRGEEATNFITALQNMGFETNWKRAKIYNNGPQARTNCTADWDIGIVVDIFKNIDNFDTLILGSADGDFAPMTELLRSLNKTVIIFACEPSNKLKEHANLIFDITRDQIQ